MAITKAPYARELYIAQLAVLRASILTKQVQSAVSGISKHDSSPVTIADFAAQALLIKAIHEAFPNDAFLGEEDSSVLRDNEGLSASVFELVSSVPDVRDLNGVPLPKPASMGEMLDLIDLGGRGRGRDHGRFWVIDPVDGTATFLSGQQYAVSVALIEDRKEVVGVLGCPNISAEMIRVSEEDIDRGGYGIMLTAVRGQGSTLQTINMDGGLSAATPLNITRSASCHNLHIIDCAASDICRHDVIAELASRFGAEFPNTEIWSSHIRYAALIVGGGDVHFLVPTSPPSQICVWDHAGSQLIFTELGGKVTDLDGKDIDFGAGRYLSQNRGMVVAWDPIHERILATMNRILAEEKEALSASLRP